MWFHGRYHEHMQRLTNIDSLLELRSWMDSGRHVQLRKTAGIPQRAIADDVGVTKGCVTRWERLQRRPSGRDALAYHRVLRRLAEVESARVSPAPATAP